MKKEENLAETSESYLDILVSNLTMSNIPENITCKRRIEITVRFDLL